VQGASMDTLDRDWLAEAAPDGPRWALWTRAGRLHFRAAAAPPPVSAGGAGAGEFAGGLWEGDVAELFLLNPATGFYVEFNLSPGGAWWCCAFDAPRARSGSPAPLPGVEARAAGPGDGWEAELTVPLASMPPALAFDAEATRGNVAFCLGRPQRHFTLADLGGGPPDFHRPSKWIPLRGMLGGPLCSTMGGTRSGRRPRGLPPPTPLAALSLEAARQPPDQVPLGAFPRSAGPSVASGVRTKAPDAAAPSGSGRPHSARRRRNP
jgi:hypothetical protein